MLTCSHCGKETTYPFAAEFKRADAGRFICGDCKKEFFVLDNVPMTKRQYAVKIKSHNDAQVDLTMHLNQFGEGLYKPAIRMLEAEDISVRRTSPLTPWVSDSQ